MAVKIGDTITDGTVVWKVTDASGAKTGTAQEEGLTKLYTGMGQQTDGTMTQKAITDAITSARSAASNVAYNIPTSAGYGNIWIS